MGKKSKVSLKFLQPATEKTHFPVEKQLASSAVQAPEFRSVHSSPLVIIAYFHHGHTTQMQLLSSDSEVFLVASHVVPTRKVNPQRTIKNSSMQYNKG